MTSRFGLNILIAAGSVFLFTGSASAGDTAADIARALMPDLDKFEIAYRKAKASSANDGADAQPGGRSRSWKRKKTERTRGYHSNVPALQDLIKNKAAPKPVAAAPALAAAPEPVAAPVVPPSPVYSTQSVTFELDSARLTAEGKAILRHTIFTALQQVRRQVAERTRSWGENEMTAEFVVAGHTDASGPDDYNLDLSQRRANAVCNYLRSLGPVGALDCVGFGEDQLADPSNPTASVNRRVDFAGKFIPKRTASN